MSLRRIDLRLALPHEVRRAAAIGLEDWSAGLEEAGVALSADSDLDMAVAPVDRTPVSPWPNQVEKKPVDISPEQLKFIQDHGSSLLTEEFYADQMRITAETLLPLIK